MNPKQVLNDMRLRQWKKVGNPYECVGLEILLLTDSGEVLRGYRKEPTQVKAEPNMYYRKSSDEKIDSPMFWDYI